MLHFLLNIAFAQERGVSRVAPVQLTNPLQVGSIEALISQVTKYIVGVSAALVVLIVVWAAFQLVLKSDQPSARKEALDRIKWAVIGFGVMLLAGGIVSFVVSFLGGTSGTSDLSPEPYIEQSTKLGPQPGLPF